MGNWRRWWQAGTVKVQDGLRLSGRFTLQHFRAGHLIEQREVQNLVTDAGKAAAAGLLIATGHTNAFDQLAIGIGTTAAAAGDTALGSEITTNGGQRAAATLSRVTTDVTNDTAQLVVTFTFTGTFAVTEAGVFDTPTSGGVLLSRQVFAAVNVVSTDALVLTWKLDFD